MTTNTLVREETYHELCNLQGEFDTLIHMEEAFLEEVISKHDEKVIDKAHLHLKKAEAHRSLKQLRALTEEIGHLCPDHYREMVEKLNDVEEHTINLRRQIRLEIKEYFDGKVSKKIKKLSSQATFQKFNTKQWDNLKEMQQAIDLMQNYLDKLNDKLYSYKANLAIQMIQKKKEKEKKVEEASEQAKASE